MAIAYTLIDGSSKVWLARVAPQRHAGPRGATIGRRGDGHHGSGREQDGATNGGNVMKSLCSSAVIAFLLAVMLLGAPDVAEAQHDALRTFGPAPLATYTVQAFAFTAPSATEHAKLVGGIGTSRECSSNCTLGAPVFLPAGAVVEGIELEVCGTFSTDSSIAVLQRNPAGSESFPGIASVNTIGQPPGCVRPQSFVAPATIDNQNNAYSLHADLNPGTRLRAIRIYYHLQVSNPDPPVATFNDVPTTHPFWRFVEALVESGITVGCSANPPLYCPDSFITRGQMAAFFARALGLHFP